MWSDCFPLILRRYLPRYMNLLQVITVIVTLELTNLCHETYCSVCHSYFCNRSDRKSSSTVILLVK